MYYLREQPLFSVKPSLLYRKQRRLSPRPARATGAEVLCGNPQVHAKLSHDLSAEMEKVQTNIIAGRARRRRVYRWCWGISMGVNVLAWMSFFLWYVFPRQVPPKIEGDTIRVTLHPPSVESKPPLRSVPQPPVPPIVEDVPEETPEPPEKLPEQTPEVVAETPSEEPRVEPQPPPEPPPAVVEVEEEQTIADPLELDSLDNSAEDGLTPHTLSNPIELDTLQQTGVDDRPQTDVTEITALSPLASGQDVVNDAKAEGILTPVLPVPGLPQKVDTGSPKPRGAKSALGLTELRAKEKNPIAQNQKRTGSTIKLGTLENGGQKPLRGKTERAEAVAELPDLGIRNKPKAPSEESVKPTVVFEPLSEKEDGKAPFEAVVSPSAADPKLQTLPELLTPITPKFPSLEGVKNGKVVLWLWVEKDGTPSGILVHKSTPTQDKAKTDALHKVAIDAAKEARFKPARRDGKPIRLLIQIPVWFDRSHP